MLETVHDDREGVGALSREAEKFGRVHELRWAPLQAEDEDDAIEGLELQVVKGGAGIPLLVSPLRIGGSDPRLA